MLRKLVPYWLAVSDIRVRQQAVVN
jgi:hypothetical protein